MNRSLVTLLPLDCLSVILGYCEIKEVITRHSLVHRNFLAASRLESTWDQLFRTCNLDSFFALQQDLAKRVPIGRQRAEAIDAVSKLRRELEDEVQEALQGNTSRPRTPSLRRSSFEAASPELPPLAFHTAPPNLRSQTFLLLLDLAGVPDVMKLSDFVTITTLCCRLVEYLNTGSLGVLNSGNSFFSCSPSAREVSAVEEVVNEGANQARRRQLQHTLRSTLRPGFLCDPFATRFDCQNRMIELDVPSELLVLLSCIGGQDMDVVSQPQHFVPQEEPATYRGREGTSGQSQGSDYNDTLGLHLEEDVGTLTQRVHYSGLLGSAHFYDQHHNRFMLSPAHCLQAYQHQKDEVAAMMVPLHRAASGSQDSFRRSSSVGGESSADTCYHFPMERVFPFATSEVGGRLGIVLRDIVLLGTTSVDSSLTSTDNHPLSHSSEDGGVPMFKSSVVGGPGGPSSNQNHGNTVVYRRGTILLYSISRNANNAFVVAPSLTHFFTDLVNGAAGYPAEFYSSSSTSTRQSHQGTESPENETGPTLGSSVNQGRFFQRYEPHPRFGGILRNPTFSRWTSHCVTEGVEVVMSPAFLPDQSKKNVRYAYTYQCTVRFLYPTQNNPGPTCQLEGRRWELKHFRRNTNQATGSSPSSVLYSADKVELGDVAKQTGAVGGEARPPVGCVYHRTDEVEGKGVVGAYPLLVCPDRQQSEFIQRDSWQQPPSFTSDEEDLEDSESENSNSESLGQQVPTSTPPVGRFQYSSCAEFQFPYGEMSGSFTFVPGSLTQPIGPPFTVQVAPFICEYREDLLKNPASVLWPQPEK